MNFIQSARDLSRNPLGIIALFIVLVYGFACLLFGVSVSSLTSSEKQPIIWFVVLFPALVLFVFGWLVSKHHDKLYAPTDYRDDSSFLKTTGQNPVDAENNFAFFEDLLVYGEGLEIISERESIIKAEMKKRGLTFHPPTTDVLIRQLAASQTIVWIEQTYQTIFGSQIILLKKAINSKDGLSSDEVSYIFKEAQKKHSADLSSWTLDQYLNFLLQSNLIDKVNDKFYSTTRAKEFIEILSNANYNLENRPL